MVLFHDAVFALALSVMALALAGCGSSSGGDSPAPPPPPTPPRPVEFASQSVEGTIEGTESLMGSEPVPLKNGMFGLFIDADKMIIRADASGEVSANQTKEPVSAQAESRAMVNVDKQQVTYFYNASLAGSDITNCSYTIITEMPSAEQLKALIKLLPVTKAADGNKQMSLDKYKIDQKNVTGTASVTMELGNDDNIFKKFSADLELTAPTKDSTKGNMAATKTSAGAPDASKLVVDKSWGDCKKVPFPDMYNDVMSQQMNLPLKMVFQLLQIKVDTTTETQSDTIAI